MRLIANALTAIIVAFCWAALGIAKTLDALIDRPQKATQRECHHDTTTHDYATIGQPERVDRVCDRCDQTIATDIEGTK